MALSRIGKISLGILGVAALLWLNNTSLFSMPSDSRPRVVAHRGQYQNFDKAGIDSETCTASRILPPSHPYLENTIDSMKAAFSQGADVVELDVHLTPDKVFAVFHDWTLDCRTDGSGVTEETPMSVLKTLDIGYGYTADGGKTFPFRGKGVGLMPTLAEVLTALPEGRFLINFKSRRSEEGEALAALLKANPAFRKAVFGVYGGTEPTIAAIAGVPGLRGYDRHSAMNCLVNYMGLGWSGYVPQVCRNSLVPVPVNWAPVLWGWPYRFEARMRDAGSEVILMGPYSKGDPATTGIDTDTDWQKVPQHFAGLIWTNRIEVAKPPK